MSCGEDKEAAISMVKSLRHYHLYCESLVADGDYPDQRNDTHPEFNKDFHYRLLKRLDGVIEVIGRFVS